MNWNADELTDAVPLRLHEMVRFDAETIEAANADTPVAPRRNRLRCRYLPDSEPSAFIRVY